MRTYAESPIQVSGQATLVVMTMLAVLAISGGAIYGRYENSARAAKSASLTTDSNIVSSSVRQVLYDANLCTNALQGTQIPTATGGAQGEVPFSIKFSNNGSNFTLAQGSSNSDSTSGHQIYNSSMTMMMRFNLSDRYQHHHHG